MSDPSIPSPSLYSNASCPYAQRTRIALLEKGIEFDFTEIDLANKPDWFNEVSPTGKVPVMVHDDHRLYESAVINEYIDEVWPKPELMPLSATERASARIWIQKANSDFGSAVFYIGVSSDAEKRADNKESLVEQLQEIEDTVFADGRQYWFGDTPGLVDITYYTSIERMPVVEQNVGVSLNDYPRIRAWFERMAQRPAVKETARTPEQHIETFEYLSKRIPI